MGKNKKKSDFNKVKLKVGRGIRKGDNVTNTKFKSKKIVLREQLKQYVGTPGDELHYDIMELIKGLENKANSSHKLANLIKIKGLIHSQGKASLAYVSQVMHKTCVLLLDKDARVRKEALNVIHLIFGILTEIQMSSLYPVLQSYLSCTATHINVDIRSDSLKFLDLILKFFPRAICDSCSAFENFLDLVSYKSDVKSKSSKQGRMLISTPSENITAQEWRVKVFHRLIKFFDANIRILKEENDDNPNTEFDFDREKYSMAIVRHCKFRIENMLSFGIKRTDTIREDSCTLNAQFIDDFMSELMPLLFATWKEAVPHSVAGKSFGGDLSTDAPIVMMTVLKVFSCIAEWISLMTKQILSAEFLRDFKEKHSYLIQVHLLQKFPFSIPSSVEILGENFDITERIEISGLRINLTICKVFASIVLGTEKSIVIREKSVLDFVLKIAKLSNIQKDILMYVVDILNLFLLNEEFYSSCEPHLCVMLDNYHHFNGENKVCIRKFFANVSLDLEYRQFCDNSTLQLWFKYLPQEFHVLAKEQVVDNDYLYIIKKIAGRGYPAFIESLEKNFDGIIEVLQIPNKKVQEVAALLISKVPNFTGVLFYKLALAIRNPDVSLRNIKYIVVMLNYRMTTQRNIDFTAEDYLSFLMNIAVGISPGDEDKWIIEESEISHALLKSIPLGLSSFTILPSKDWSYHRGIVEVAIDAMLKLPNQDGISTCVQSFIELFLSNLTHIPAHCTAAIFELHTNFITEEYLNKNYMDKNIERNVTNLILSFYLYETALIFLPSKRDKQAYRLLGMLEKIHKNVPEIFKLILKNISSISKTEDAHFVGNVLLRLMETTSLSLSSTDSMLLPTILQNLTDILGKEGIVNGTWHKELMIRLSSAKK